MSVDTWGHLQREQISTGSPPSSVIRVGSVDSETMPGRVRDEVYYLAPAGLCTADPAIFERLGSTQIQARDGPRKIELNFQGQIDPNGGQLVRDGVVKGEEAIFEEQERDVGGAAVEVAEGSGKADEERGAARASGEMRRHNKRTLSV